MKKILISAAAAILSIMAANAQTVHENWHDIDKVTVYSQFHTSECKALYLVPVDESSIVYKDDLGNGAKKKIAKNLAAFRDIIKTRVSKKFPGLDIRIVDQMPQLAAGESALQIKYTEFDTGSVAGRAFGGFAADKCNFSITGSIVGSDGTSVDFQHRSAMTGNPFGAYQSFEMVKAFEEDMGDLIAELFTALNGE